MREHLPPAPTGRGRKMDDLNQVQSLLRSLEEEMMRQLLGDGASTFAPTAPPPSTLTADSVREMARQFQQKFGPPPLRVIEVDPYPVRVQARTHRKKRINKKWRKRYGTKTEWRQLVPSGKAFVDNVHGVAYCNRGEMPKGANGQGERSYWRLTEDMYET